MAPPPEQAPVRRGFWGSLRVYLLTGLLVLAPSAVTLWVLYLLFTRVDNLLGRYLRFAFVDYRRIPGLGLLATLLLLMTVGWVASWIVARPLVRMWDMLLTRIPGIGIVYGSTKSLGEALLNREEQAFRQALAARGLQVREVTEIDGVNYSKGDETALRVYVAPGAAAK